MDNSLLITKYVQSILEQNQDVLNIVGNDKKIFTLLQPEEISFPFIVHARTSLSVNYTKDIEYGKVGWWNNVQFTVSCVSDKYTQALELANAARHALETFRWKDENIYIHPIQLTSVSEYTIEDQAFVEELIFECMVE